MLKVQVSCAKDKASKKRIVKNYERVLKEAKIEAHLCNIKYVKYLAWDPEVTVYDFPKYNTGGTLKGKYVCQYEDSPGELVLCQAPMDVAESNFEVVAL